MGGIGSGRRRKIASAGRGGHSGTPARNSGNGRSNRPTISTRQARSTRRRHDSDDDLPATHTAQLQEEDEMIALESGNHGPNNIGNNQEATTSNEAGAVGDAAQSPETPASPVREQIEERRTPHENSVPVSASQKDWKIQHVTKKMSAKCRLCNDGVYWCFSNSAFSNLQRHLMSKHADEWKQFHSSDSAGQSCNQSSMKSFVTVPVPPAKAEMLDLLFGKMLIDTNMPLTFSANASVRDFFEVILNFQVLMLNIQY